MIRSLLTAAFCLSVGAASAATINPLLARSDVCGRFEVFHINGIMTDREEAEANLRRVAAVYGNSYKEHIIYYGLAYNQTRNFKNDFYDWAVQAISAYVGATWDSFMNYVTFGVISPFMPDATAVIVAKQISDFFAFTKPSAYQDQDLADIMYDIKVRSYQHSRMVLVAHSQGNLYANLVYDKLVAEGIKPAKSLGVVGIAVPTLGVRSGNNHITSSNDVVVDTARKALPAGAVIAPNITIPISSADFLGHNLISIYLANSTARSMLNSRITNEFLSLRTTAPDPTGGIISNSHAYKCGEIEGGPYAWTVYIPACKAGIPDDRTTPTWHKNVIMNYFPVAGEGWTQHAYGTGSFTELQAYNKAHSTGCYNWWVADRKAWIKKYNYVPYNGYGWEYTSYPGCGSGFPWQTPYGNPDAAWKIYSADTYKYVSTNETGKFTATGEVVFWNNKWVRQAVCSR